MTRPEPLRASPVPGGGTASASSVSVFHSPHVAHLPAQRGEKAPQFWHTNVVLIALAIVSAALVEIDAVEAGAEPGQHLVADGAGRASHHLDGKIGAYEVDPVAAHWGGIIDVPSRRR